MKKELTNQQIQILVNKPGVRKRSVENFLRNIHCNLNKTYAIANLSYDAKAKDYNQETINVITEGIKLVYRD